MMECTQCGIDMNRTKNLVATVTKIQEKRIVAEITEPQERPMVRGGKPFVFGFWLNEGIGEASHSVDLCSLNCLRLYIEDSIEERNEKTQG